MNGCGRTYLLLEKYFSLAHNQKCNGLFFGCDSLYRNQMEGAVEHVYIMKLQCYEFYHPLSDQPQETWVNNSEAKWRIQSLTNQNIFDDEVAKVIGWECVGKLF